MTFAVSRLKLTALSLAATMAVCGVATNASAMPFATIGAGKVGVVDSEIVEVGYKGRRHAARHRARNNAALGAAIAIGVLGVAAAAAASQPRRGTYVVDNRYYPVDADAWGRPIYGARPVQHYEPGYYYYREPQPYGSREPAWGGHRPAPYGYQYRRSPDYVDQGYGRGWNQPTWNQRMKQQYRAQREAQKQHWRAACQQQQWGGSFDNSVGAGIGNNLRPPTSFFGNENGGR